MKNHPTESIRNTSPRYHRLRKDGLYHPIPFLFVTDRMCDDILDEREMLLASLPAATHDRQKALFAGNDPRASSKAFKHLLRRFGYPFINRLTA